VWVPQDKGVIDGREVWLSQVQKHELYAALTRPRVRGRSAADVCIQMRGLPFQAREPEIRTFFSGAFDAVVSCSAVAVVSCTVAAVT
jgi:hypothetical protein